MSSHSAAVLRGSAATSPARRRGPGGFAAVHSVPLIYRAFSSAHGPASIGKLSAPAPDERAPRQGDPVARRGGHSSANRRRAREDLGTHSVNSGRLERPARGTSHFRLEEQLATRATGRCRSGSASAGGTNKYRLLLLPPPLPPSNGPSMSTHGAHTHPGVRGRSSRRPRHGGGRPTGQSSSRPGSDG